MVRSFNRVILSKTKQFFTNNSFEGENFIFVCWVKKPNSFDSLPSNITFSSQHTHDRLFYNFFYTKKSLSLFSQFLKFVRLMVTNNTSLVSTDDTMLNKSKFSILSKDNVN